MADSFASGGPFPLSLRCRGTKPPLAPLRGTQLGFFPMPDQTPPPKPLPGGRLALGVVLVLVGVGWLAARILDVTLDIRGVFWPWLVVIPGVAILVASFVSSRGRTLAMFGAVITSIGLLLVYQNATGNWASWAYGWALVGPAGSGAGRWLHGRVRGVPDEVVAGRRMVLVGLALALVGFAFFEGVLGLTLDLGEVGDFLLPLLLIVLGVALLLRRRRGDSAA